MKAQSLKNAILQLAVQGKLVPQNSGDEPVSLLLKKIKSEKEQLIKDKKIKSEKSLPKITDEEKPFDIPKSWEWVRLGDVNLHVHYGYTASAQNIGNSKLLRITDIQNNKVNWDDVPFCQITDKEYMAYGLNNRDIMIARTGGTIGKSYIVRELNEKAVFASYLIRIIPSLMFNEEYLKYFFDSPFYWAQLKDKSMGTGQPNVNGTALKELIICAPPLAEQQRIVAKIEQLMPLIDKYDLYEQELSALDKKLPQDLKKSILQFAVQGKLVAQDKADEPASMLLKKINLEKKQIIKGKKIKAEKPLPKITEDEKPFAIPESWEWVRLGELGDIVGGGTPKTQNDNYWNNGNIPWLTPADMSRIHGKLVERGSRMITNEGLLKSSARLLPKNSIIYSSRAPIGYIGIASNELCTNQGFKSLVPINNEIVEYLYYSLIQKTPDIQSRASGTTFKEISGSEFALTVLPLPPLAEQQRIVAKVESLMALCEILKDESKLMKYEIPTKLGRIITFTHETTEGYEPEHLIAARAEVIRPETQQKQQERIALMRKKK